jgi:uncharacterized LabA/DUF88 family protein
VAPNQPDAADEVLLSYVHGVDLSSFGAVYIGSGDHRFVEAARAAKSAAACTICVTAGGPAARALVNACDSGVFLGRQVASQNGRPGQASVSGASGPFTAVGGIAVHTA